MRTLIAAFALFVVGVTPDAAHACECFGGRPACGEAWRADAVFVGTVTSVEPVTAFSGRVQLSVAESFRGPRLPQVSLATGETTCSYPFRLGESYLVYAHRSPTGELFTAICSRTRPLAGAKDDLTFLRSIAAIRPGDLARLTGRVYLSELRTDIASPTMPGIKVTASGGGRTFSTRTNRRGRFELTGLPVGIYEIAASAPNGYESSARTLELHDPRGCGEVVLYVRYDGRVAGQVVDSGGNGIHGLPLELVPAAELDKTGIVLRRVQTRTAADGTFEFRLVAPGDYVLAFNSIRNEAGQLPFPRILYPGVEDRARAASVVVSPKGRVRLGQFVVPSSIDLVTIDGLVLNVEDQPVRGAEILLLRGSLNRTHDLTSHSVSDIDGRFTFSVIAAHEYVIHATAHPKTAQGGHESLHATVPFRAEAGSQALRVVLRPRERPAAPASIFEAR